MEVTVLEREPMIVVGWKARFISILSPDATSINVIGDLWSTQFNYDLLKGLPGSLGHPTWGVIWADPKEMRSHPAELNYLAGVPFSAVPELPEGLSSYRVPGGKYAMITHRGPLSGLKGTVEHIHKWAADNGYTEPDNWCDLELYDERFFKEGPEQAFDYFISIQPLAQPQPQVTIKPAPKLSEDTGARSHEFKQRTDALRSGDRKDAAKQPAKAKSRKAKPAKKAAKKPAKKPAKKAAKKTTKKRSKKKAAKRPTKKAPGKPARKAKKRR